MRRLLTILLACSIPLLLVACDKGSSGRRTWKASDHDQEETGTQLGEPATVAAPRVATPAATNEADVAPSPHGADSPKLADAMQFWSANCVRCHGQIGAGDGPDGPRFMARNLTDANWQSTATDDQISASIVQGKGMMPAFPGAAKMLDELVPLIRKMGAPKMADGPGAEGDSGSQVTRPAANQASSSQPREGVPTP